MKFGSSIKYIKAWLLTCILFAAFISGCTEEKKKSPSQKEATLVYIKWDEGIAYTHLAANILEEHLGYEITLISAELGAAYKAVAENTADAFMESWQPVLHRDYLNRYEDQLVDLGPVFDSTKSGLVVPSYVPIDSIRELHKTEVRRKLDGIITGIEQGAGIMGTTKDVMKRYELNYRLQSSSGPAMTAALKRAIMNRSWIVVTGWKPHLMFNKWNLQFLKQDPDKKLWTEGSIHIMGSKGIQKQKPVLARFLQNMHLTEQQLYDLMLTIDERTPDKEVSEITKTWMKENSSLVQKWIPGQ